MVKNNMKEANISTKHAQNIFTQVSKLGPSSFRAQPLRRNTFYMYIYPTYHCFNISRGRPKDITE